MKLALFFLALFAGKAANAQQESLLTERVLNITLESAKLSGLSYLNASEYAILDARGNVAGYQHPDYEQINFYTQEPDQAIVAKTGGRCYIAFRGTSASLADWEQNIDTRSDDAYKNNDNTTGEFCEVRRGYSDFLRTDLVGQAYLDLISCIPSCTQDDCVVITGHSQGGASAAVASILLYDLMPTVVTFGMPAAAKAGCTLIPSERLFRFVNHRKEENEDDDLGFDPVPFLTALGTQSVHYGHYLLVGPDKTAAKYLGFDTNYTFIPAINDRQNEIEAHTMAGANYSYTSRITALLNTGNTAGFPVSMRGFAPGTVCETGYRQLCATGSCQNNLCSEKVSDLCIPDTCRKDDDCESGTCIYGACAAGSDAQVEDGCPCRFNGQCKSGDCNHEGISLDLGGSCEFSPGEVMNGTSPISAGEYVSYLKSLVLVVVLGTLSWL